jgi:putative membrane protein
MTKPRKPASFRLEEIELVETPLPPPAIATDAAQLPATVRALPALERGWRWGSILLAAVGGLVGLASVVWLHDLVREMMARQDWIGWTTIGLLGLAILALLMIILREAAGLARLGRLGRLRHEADAAALEGDKALALDVVSRLKRLITGARTSPGDWRGSPRTRATSWMPPSCCGCPSARSSLLSIRSRAASLPPRPSGFRW